MTTTPGSPGRGWLAPVVYLSNNWISLLGVVIVTSATVFWLVMLPSTLRGEVANPYSGILMYMALPAIFFSGLILIPLGILWEKRRERVSGKMPANFPPLDFQNRELRRLVAFIGVTTFANVIIAGQLSYSAVNYMDSVTFCGQTCHTVMQPEFTAYQNSPHSRVECVQCHIGPGAGWFVRSKLSGVRQVFAVTFHTYSRPIAAPVHDLRPARETCEACHWPQQYGGDRLKVISKFADDEHNTATKTVLMMHIGGGNGRVGIHGVHMGVGIRIRYAHSDEKRQVIPWVEYKDASGKATEYTSTDAKGAMPGNLDVRDMDCIDCHNRPTHAYQLPRAGGGPEAGGRIDCIGAAFRQEDCGGAAEGGICVAGGGGSEDTGGIRGVLSREVSGSLCGEAERYRALGAGCSGGVPAQHFSGHECHVGHVSEQHRAHGFSGVFPVP